MNRPRPRHILLATATMASLALPLAAPAYAVESTTTTRPPRTERARPTVDIESVRTRCIAAIDKRLATLGELDDRVAAADKLSDAQAGDLTATIDATRSGLTALRSEIETDTDATEMRADCKRIVDDYRVYVLLSPQVRLVIGADSAQSAVDLVEGSIDDIQAAIDAAAASGEDVTEATRLLADVQSSIEEADQLAVGILAAVSPLTPADYNAGTAQPVLRDARSDLGQVAKELTEARADIAMIRTLLD